MGEQKEVPKELSKNLLPIFYTIPMETPLASIKCINSNFKDGENGYITEINEFSNCFQSEDFIEGTNAFIEKRKAKFK